MSERRLLAKEIFSSEVTVPDDGNLIGALGEGHGDGAVVGVAFLLHDALHFRLAIVDDEVDARADLCNVFGGTRGHGAVEGYLLESRHTEGDVSGFIGRLGLEAYERFLARGEADGCDADECGEFG